MQTEFMGSVKTRFVVLTCLLVLGCTLLGCTSRSSFELLPDSESCSPASCVNGFCDAAGKCQPKLPNGAACGDVNNTACQSDHCDNGVCCSGTACCQHVNDCPPLYSGGSVCTDMSTATDCQGSRSEAACVDYQCVSTAVHDDSGCAGMSHTCPDNLQPIVCTAQAAQTAPVCPSGCDEPGDCLSGFDCIGGACLVFDWTTLGPDYWPELQGRLQAEAAKGNSAAPEARLLMTEDFSTYASGRWQGATLAPDGYIYGMPRNVQYLIRLDPDTGLTEEGGPDFSAAAGWVADKWYGGRLAHDGNIFAAASDTAQNLRVIPGDFAAAAPFGPAFPAQEDGAACSASSDPGCNKWSGLAVVPNGHLIACPRTGVSVLDLDPSDPTAAGVRRITDPDILADSEKWVGAILAPNGKVYCIPAQSPQILEIDPDNLTDSGIQLVGPLFTPANYPELTSPLKWTNGSLAANGKIYAFPALAPRVLQIDPTDLSSSGTGPVGPAVTPPAIAGGAWQSGALAPDGRIYAPPSHASGILVIDPVLLDADPNDSNGVYTFEVTPSPLGESMMKYNGAVLAPNGRIYAFPWFVVYRILEIEPHAEGTFDMDVLLNGHLNGQ